MGNFCCKKKHYAKTVQFINELGDTYFHFNPKGFITCHERRAHGVLMTSIDFQGFSFRQQRLLPLDWNDKVVPLN